VEEVIENGVTRPSFRTSHTLLSVLKCSCLSKFSLLNHLTSFHGTWNRHYSFGCNSVTTFLISYTH
jgi:hypothetical protein